LPYPPIKALYITAPSPFPALEAFVLASVSAYNLDLYRFGGGMKVALTEYLRCGGGRGVKGVMVGTRRGDPNGNVAVLAPTDPSWPDFLRIHPILDWSYKDIWDCLRELEVDWCSLYDEGYTSLGSITNTRPNPLLKNPDSATGWDPAWKLQDERQERAGRI
ncbi:FAD synthetase, partial [Tremellales sp. Uapishka_1]